MSEINERVVIYFENKMISGIVKKKNLKRQFDMLKGETNE